MKDDAAKEMERKEQGMVQYVAASYICRPHRAKSKVYGSQCMEDMLSQRLEQKARHEASPCVALCSRVETELRGSRAPSVAYLEWRDLS
jgi:hypothetical protein